MTIRCNCGKSMPYAEVACSLPCLEAIMAPMNPPNEDWRHVGMSQKSDFGRVVWSWMTSCQRDAVVRELTKNEVRPKPNLPESGGEQAVGVSP